MALAQISIVPVGTGGSSIGDWIAEAVRVLENEGAKYELSSMGTLIEGKPKEVFLLAKKVHEAAFAKGIRRVITTIVIDDRRDKEVTMKSKITSVKKRLRKTG
jgi:uncharacterized protein (TIGR00106 family)